MKTIVITGSSRGIGNGLARAFLARGCQVVVSGSTPASTEKAASALLTEFPPDNILGCPCNVTHLSDHNALWSAATARFGKVDVWINNAGIGHPMQKVWELPVERYRDLVETNLMGVLYGSRVAIAQMLQQRSGQLFNMEGFGSDGRLRAGLSVYGTTKSAVTYLTRSLAAEVQGTPVLVGRLSPGIVITEFLSDPYKADPQGFESAKKIFSILGDKVETVTPWLAERVLSNRKNGASFNWLTSGKVLWRFATARFTQRDLYA
ncbi:MAG TPA: SDR family oxidoreductase [Anaerolineales bacterium]|nr:SDR family oxidoreductase [Anaerolineales bacterium]